MRILSQPDWVWVCRLATVLAVLAGVLGGAGNLRAQTDATGTADPAAAMAQAAAAPAAAASAPKAAAAGGTGFMAPDSFMGLLPVEGPRPVVGFDDAMRMVLENSFDLAIAREKLFQTELLVRKAWSSVLPRLSATVGYQFSWPEVKFQGVSQGSLDQQADYQRLQLEQQAQIYDAQAEASRADGDYNSEYANRALAAQLRRQKSGVQAGTAPDAIVINPAHTLNGSVSFSVVLFNGRALPLLLNAYDVVRQTRLTLDRGRTQALYMAALGYFNAVSARKLMVIASNQIDNLTRSRDVTKVRVDVGTLPPLALKRSETDLERARASLRTVQNAYQSALSSLAMTLGLETEFDVGELPVVPLLEDVVDEPALLARAESNRPDLAAAKLQVAMAERNRLDALMRWMPTVTLGGSARATSNVQGFNKEPLTYGVALNATIPLYDGGERYTAYREAGSQIREARLLLAQTQTRLRLSVRGNLREIRLRRDNLTNQREALKLAEANARDVRTRNEVGAATQLEVLDAEQLVTNASLDLAMAEIELQMARMALSFVVGAFDPVIGEPGKALPAGVSPVDPRLLGVSSFPNAPRMSTGTAAVAPALAPPSRAAAAAHGARLGMHPSALDLVRAGLVAGDAQPAMSPLGR